MEITIDFIMKQTQFIKQMLKGILYLMKMEKLITLSP